MLSIYSNVHIALDLDEVICPFFDNLNKFYVRKYHNSDPMKYFKYKTNMKTYNYSKAFNVDEAKAKFIVREFYSSHEAKNIKPYKTSFDKIKMLKDQGAKLSIITGRQTYPECKNLTYAFVNNYFGSTFDNIVLTNSHSLYGKEQSKLDISRELDVDILVDDCVSNFKECENEIKSIKSDYKILTLQYLHVPRHPWTDKTYKNNIETLKDIDKYL